MFISIDGVDGAGKSTQLGLLEEWLRTQGHEVVVCRDPGSTALGEQIREILLHRESIAIDLRAEMLLYMAARAQLVEEIIRPALERKQIVLSDRFLLANVVYQGHGGGLSVDSLWSVGALATGGLEPDITVILDLPAEHVAQRLGDSRDRMESRGLGFLTRVREGFLSEARRFSNRMHVVSALAPVDEVQARIREQVTHRLDGPS